MSQNEISAVNVVDPTVISALCREQVWCMSTGTGAHGGEEAQEGVV